MKVVHSIDELRRDIRSRRERGQRVGFVPTMGALHEGHLSLVRVARGHSDAVVVSIFVNPTQFGPTEDFRIYPRTPEKDLALLDGEATDLVFMPDVSEVYGKDAQITVDPGPAGSTFEGRIRPDHFRGVLTVVAKLFNMVQPDCAVFGQKDAQQIYLIRRMVRDLNFPLEIIEADTIREGDGLAKSSRNVYLKVGERPLATVLYRALCAAQRRFAEGDAGLKGLQSAMADVIESVPEFTADYATAVSKETYGETDPVADTGRLIIAGRLGSVRLIDNMRLK